VILFNLYLLIILLRNTSLLVTKFNIASQIEIRWVLCQQIFKIVEAILLFIFNFRRLRINISAKSEIELVRLLLFRNFLFFFNLSNSRFFLIIFLFRFIVLKKSWIYIYISLLIFFFLRTILIKLNTQTGPLIWVIIFNARNYLFFNRRIERRV